MRFAKLYTKLFFYLTTEYIHYKVKDCLNVTTLFVFRMHKVPGCCYESGATRLFLGGRTETIRSCSIESMHFVRTFMDACASVEDKMKALCQAIQAHKKYAIEVRQKIFMHMQGNFLNCAHSKNDW